MLGSFEVHHLALVEDLGFEHLINLFTLQLLLVGFHLLLLQLAEFNVLGLPFHEQFLLMRAHPPAIP